jgi:hypothetical protein
MDRSNKNSRDGAEPQTPGRKWLLIVAALWLNTIVIAFVVVQLNRIHTPVVEWAKKIAELVVGR